MRKVIAVANQKGGVGKTTTAMNIGVELCQKGKKVLLIDFDHQANLTSYLGCEENKTTIFEIMLTAIGQKKTNYSQAVLHSQINNVDFIPSDISLANAENSFINTISKETILKRILQDTSFADYEYILIDCPPSLGLLLINALAAATHLLIPVQAQKFSLDGLQFLIGTFSQVKAILNPDIQICGILPTMVDNTNIAKDIVDAINDNYKALCFKHSIRRSVEAVNSTYCQKAMVLGESKIGRDYKEVTKELLIRLGDSYEV